MSAKWLLHHRACTSRLEDMGPGTYFHRVILEGGRGDNTRDIGSSSKTAHTSSSSSSGSSSSTTENSTSSTSTSTSGPLDSDPAPHDLLDPAHIRRIVFCCGKVFYHLYHARAAAGIRDVTLVRVEQIAPFPYDLIGPAVQKYPLAELVWVQEEAKNQGAWTYVKPRFDTALREARVDRAPIRFVGRKPSASPASGGYNVHVQEQKEVMDAALR
jgi:2-oxoglutarate dehydrogenase complex dehydrogenase (E1) component-like enzyme